jgi:AbrB family looped-hinge helix DNA binding protein
MAALGKVQARGQVTLPSAIRRAVGLKPGDVVLIEATGPNTVRLKTLPRLTLAEALERFRVRGPIDDAADREAWQDTAARDVMGSMESSDAGA